MSLHKECADQLRYAFFSLTGERLRSGHAHEIVAAYFGYGTAAALRSGSAYPMGEMPTAAVIIPDIAMLERRLHQLVDLPASLPPPRGIATFISEYLTDERNFGFEIWDAEYLSDDINGYIQNHPSVIEDELSGEMAETNAFFDEIYVDEVEVETDADRLVATISGDLNGETHDDKAFHGDKIEFTSVMTMPRVAGRIGYGKPEFETGGSVDRSM